MGNSIDQHQRIPEPQRTQQSRSKGMPRPGAMDPHGRYMHKPLPTIPQDEVPHLDQPPSAPTSIEGHDMDEVDEKIQAYFQSNPDFCVDATKVRKGWYLFGKPIGKKVFMKVIGKDRVVVRVGGGYKALDQFFDNYR